MDLNLLLTLIFGLIGACGVGTSIYYGKKSASLERTRISIDFEDLTAASSDIADYLKANKFDPDIVYTPGAKSALLAELLSKRFTVEPTVVVGVLNWKDSGLKEVETNQLKEIESNKWKILVPELLILNPERKILLVDDIAMSGDGLCEILELLIENGFKKENIKTATLVCTSVAIASKKEPDYYWRKTDGITYYFPWGKTR